jgi:hypothetical protein
VDARRLRPTQDTDEVAAEQVRVLVERLPEPEVVANFVFDAFSTILSNSSALWNGTLRGSW